MNANQQINPRSVHIFLFCANIRALVANQPDCVRGRPSGIKYVLARLREAQNPLSRNQKIWLVGRKVITLAEGESLPVEAV